MQSQCDSIRTFAMLATSAWRQVLANAHSGDVQCPFLLCKDGSGLIDSLHFELVNVLAHRLGRNMNMEDTTS